MNLTLYQVDAFTTKPFGGNPAAVCVTDQALDPDLMQQIANEMNLSETAFLVQNPDGSWHLRWFTPLAEVDLCGHATLASAHALYEIGLAQPDEEIRFSTLSGELRVARQGDGLLEMNFPAEPVDRPFSAEEIDRALGVTCTHHAANRMDAFAEVDSEETLLAMQPDLSAIGAMDVRGLIVTAKASTDGLDFVSRFFAPQCGVPEDPVTGSAHCCLAPYWAEKLGKTRMKARQVSARGGEVDVEVLGDRVVLRGHAVLVMKANLTL